MLFSKAQGWVLHTVDIAACLLFSVLFTVIGLNAIIGCGQGGECVRLADFTTTQRPQQIGTLPAHRPRESVLDAVGRGRF